MRIGTLIGTLSGKSLKCLAEGGRFELPRACDPGGFQDRCLQPGSATPPDGRVTLHVGPLRLKSDASRLPPRDLRHAAHLPVLGDPREPCYTRGMSADVRELLISGPGRNALSGTLMEQLLLQVAGAGGRPLLVTGAGAAFSAGLDLKEVAALDRPRMARFLGRLDALVDALFDYPRPTVACVNGHAIAGGGLPSPCACLALPAC